MKNIKISKHAREQMEERGATEDEVAEAIREGEEEPANFGRTMYRRNFQFNGEWFGQRYKIKQVAPVIAEEPDSLVVVTVFTFYF